MARRQGDRRDVLPERLDKWELRYFTFILSALAELAISCGYLLQIGSQAEY